MITIESSGNKIWTRNYVLILSASVISNTIHMLTLATLPMYAIILGGNNLTMGLVTSIYFVAALCTRPMCGKLLDQKGRKAMLLVGIGLIIAASGLYGWVAHVGLLLFLRFINGVGYSMVTTAAGTAVADLVPSTRIAEGIGYFSSTITIAIALGPALGLFVVHHWGYPALFLCLTSLGLLSFLILSFVNYEKTAAISNQNQPVEKGAFMERSALPLASVMFLVALSISGILTFLPAYSVDRHIENISIFFLVYALAMLLPRTLLGRIVDRHGGERVILPGMLFTFCCMILLAFGHSLPFVLSAAVCFGLGYGSLQPTINSMIIKIAPDNRRGAANATFLALADIGFCVGTALWGYLSGEKGFTSVYSASAFCVVLAYTVFLLVQYQHKKKRSLKSYST